MQSRFFRILFCLLVAGCATQEKASDELPFKKNALIIYSDKGRPIQDALEPLCKKDARGVHASMRSKSGIAILGGRGFNYKYDDPRASEAVLYMSRKFSEALQEEIKRCAITAMVFTNANQSVDVGTHLSESLSKGKVDGIIQVNIAPKQVKGVTSLYMTVGYLAVKWEAQPQGEMVTMGSGPSESYAVDPDKPLALYARKFATTLHDKGYIGH